MKLIVPIRMFLLIGKTERVSKVVCNLPLHSCLLQARFEIVGPSHVFFMHVLVLLSNPPEQVTEHEDQSDQGPQPRKIQKQVKTKVPFKPGQYATCRSNIMQHFCTLGNVGRRWIGFE